MPRKMLRSGSLRHLITVQANTTSRDDYGGITNSWATYLTTRSSVNPVSGNQKLSDNKVSNDRSFEFMFRYDPSKNPVSPKHRISWDSRTFDIESILEYDERQHFVTVAAVEREV